MTYLLLNLIFFATLIMFLPKSFNKVPKAWWVTLAGLFVLIVVFDPLMIYLHFFEYAPSKLLGLTFFGAPVEDFFYALYTASIVPLVWNRLGEKR